MRPSKLTAEIKQVIRQELALRRSLTDKALCEKHGISRSTLWRIEVEPNDPHEEIEQDGTSISRLKYQDFSPEQKKKAIARSYAKTYLRRGKLTKSPCEGCGCEQVQMHHEDYSKPLEVKWLCRPCHMKLHSERSADSPLNQIASILCVAL